MRKMSLIYLLLALLGLVLPYCQFMPWLIENGLDFPLLVGEIVNSRIAAFGWLDVVVSVLVLFVFMAAERKDRRVPCTWLAVLGTLFVGVSFGLPLYLYLREAGARPYRI